MFRVRSCRPEHRQTCSSEALPILPSSCPSGENTRPFPLSAPSSVAWRLGRDNDIMRCIIFFFGALVLAQDAFAQDAEPGRVVFENRCARCHGSDGSGGELGPA